MYPPLRPLTYYGALTPSLAFRLKNSNGVCTPTRAYTLQSDTLRANGNYGNGCKFVGNELFVGETRALGSIFEVGEVHYYTRAGSGDNFTRQSGFFADTQVSGMQFGYGLDYDGTTVIVGSPNNSAAGTVDTYVFTLGSWAHAGGFNANTYTGTVRFGQSVAIKGVHALVGCPGRDGAGTDRGGVEYWEKVLTTWTFRQAFESSRTLNNQRFGAGVAMTDDSTAFMLIMTGATSSVVEKWTRSGSTWTYDSDAFTISDLGTAAAGDYPELDTDGTNLIVGYRAYENDSPSSNNYGIARVYNQAGTLLTEIIGTTLQNESAAGVSINAGQAAIGEPFADPSATSGAGTLSIWDICT